MEISQSLEKLFISASFSNNEKNNNDVSFAVFIRKMLYRAVSCCCAPDEPIAVSTTQGFTNQYFTIK